MKKKIGLSLAAVALVGSLFSTSSFAKENKGNAYGKIDLVGLGDSITFGYNLGENNDKPSSFAFPYLIGEDAQLEVRDLGIPGWTSSQLLDAIKNDKNFRQSIKHADYLTLDIGGNDLLQALKQSGGDPLILQGLISTMVPTLTNNLHQIIQEISNLTDAPIVVYNIYNPFQQNNPLHGLANQLLSGAINPAIGQVVLSHQNTRLADAFGTFLGKQEDYVISGDIHPTILGQEALAEIGADAFGLE